MFSSYAAGLSADIIRWGCSAFIMRIKLHEQLVCQVIMKILNLCYIKSFLKEAFQLEKYNRGGGVP
ncbi:hypothetical protein C1N70_19595 [Cytobacillus firmus]